MSFPKRWWGKLFLNDCHEKRIFKSVHFCRFYLNKPFYKFKPLGISLDCKHPQKNVNKLRLELDFVG